MTSPPAPLSTHPIHLGRGAVATVQERFTGDMSWYARYVERVADDGTEGWLMAMHDFTGPWESWEMHPNGHEIVLCTAGSLTLHQEHADGSTDRVVLGAGEAAINPPGTWHTADVDEPTTCVFVTAGVGTEHRSR